MRVDCIYQLIDQGLASEERSKVEVDAPWKMHLSTVGFIAADLADLPPLIRERVVGSLDIPSHKLILISKYRDNSILRDELVRN